MYVLIHMTDSSWIDHVEGPFDTFTDAMRYANDSGAARGLFCVASVKPPLKTFEVNYSKRVKQSAVVQAKDQNEAMAMLDDDRSVIFDSVTEI